MELLLSQPGSSRSSNRSQPFVRSEASRPIKIAETFTLRRNFSHLLVEGRLFERNTISEAKMFRFSEPLLLRNSHRR